MGKVFISCDACGNTQLFINNNDHVERCSSAGPFWMGETSCRWSVLASLEFSCNCNTKDNTTEESAFPCSVLLSLTFPYRIVTPCPGSLVTLTRHASCLQQWPKYCSQVLYAECCQQLSVAACAHPGLLHPYFQSSVKISLSADRQKMLCFLQCCEGACG